MFQIWVQYKDTSGQDAYRKPEWKFPNPRASSQISHSFCFVTKCENILCENIFSPLILLLCNSCQEKKKLIRLRQENMTFKMKNNSVFFKWINITEDKNIKKKSSVCFVVRTRLSSMMCTLQLCQLYKYIRFTVGLTWKNNCSIIQLYMTPVLSKSHWSSLLIKCRLWA